MVRKCGRLTSKSIVIIFLLILSLICCMFGLISSAVQVQADGCLKDSIGRDVNIQKINGENWSASTWRRDSEGNYTEYLGQGDGNHYFRAENGSEPLYCIQMRNPFVSGTNTVKNMSEIMDSNTIKSVSAGLYYFEKIAGNLTPKQMEQGKQCIIWTITEYFLKGGEKAVKVSEHDSQTVNAVLDKVYRAYNSGELKPIIKDIDASGAVGIPRFSSNQSVGAFYYSYNPVGNIEIIKYDSILGKNGWMSRDGLCAEFKIINRSGKDVSYRGKAIKNGEVLTNVKTTLKNDRYTVLISDVPYGSYEISEIKPGVGYVKNNTGIYVNIKTKGETVTAEIANKPVRGDIKFQKTGDDGQKLNVPFIITNNETGESHVIVTENGAFDSMKNKGESVNGNDFLLNKDHISENDYDYNYSTWFSAGVNGEYPYDSYAGSFPYGTYKLEELRCENNVGYALENTEFKISEDGTVLDLGTVTDKSIDIRTIAYDANTGNNTGVVGKTSLIDEISYTNLTVGTEYTVAGEILDKSTGEKLKIEGASAEKTFTADSGDGSIKMLYNIDSKELAGKEIVIFENLYSNGKLIAAHRDLNDENQTVYFPDISTKAGNENGDKTVIQSENVTIVDKVFYSNLKTGKEYSLRGSIINKNTGEMLDVAANEKFIADEKGVVSVEFNANTQGLADSEIVIFQELSDEKGVILAEHVDINNADQTLRVVDNKSDIAEKVVNTGEYSGYTLRLWHITAIIGIAGVSIAVIIKKLSAR